MKREVIYVVCCILVLCLSHSVVALGVTPAKNLLEYKEGSSLSGSFKIINDDAKNRELVIGTRGEFAQNIKLDVRRVSLNSGDTEKIVSYKITVPENLKPGRHVGEIVISEEAKGPTDDNAVVGAVLSVVTQVEVFVPFPGKYAEASMFTKVADDGSVHVTIPVINLGEFNLARVYANIDMYSDLGERIHSFNTDSIDIPADKKRDLAATWQADVPVGSYKAIATVIYDGESTTVENTFQIGTVTLSLEQITVNNFALGDIAKMDLLVENKWSEDFDDVYTQVKIFSDSGNVLADFNSPTETVASLSKKVLSSYWDTAGVQEGTYDTTVIIHYAKSKTVETDLQLIVKENSIEVVGLGYVLSEGGDSDFDISENIVVLLIIIIGVLILLNLLWFFILRRSLKSKNNPRNK